MANTQELRSAANRRAKREAGKAGAEAQAELDARMKPPAKGSDAALARDQRIAQEAAEKRSMLPVTAKARKQAQRRAQQRAAEEQADADARLKPGPVTQVPRQGENPPLHVLNAQALALASDVREEAVEIAKKVGATTRDLIQGRVSFRGRGNRRTRVAEENARLANQEQK